jgi:hypothetical protein
MLTAVLLLSATLVAATSTRVLDVTTGAMNKPSLVMVPELAVQATAELLVFLTVAVNCCFEPEARTAELGEIVSCIWAGTGSMVRMLTAVLLLSATLVAATSTRVLDVTTGAMNKPPPVMVPELAVQTTADFAFLTMAVNCCFEPEAKTTEFGEILSRSDCAGPPVDIPPQPTEIRVARTSESVGKFLARRRGLHRSRKDGDIRGLFLHSIRECRLAIFLTATLEED